MQLEVQPRKLRDELVQVKQHRKRELMQLRYLRDQEAIVMQSNFDSQVSHIHQPFYNFYHILLMLSYVNPPILNTNVIYY